MMDWTNDQAMTPTMTASMPSLLDDFTEFLFSTTFKPDDDDKKQTVILRDLCTLSEFTSLDAADYCEDFTAISEILPILPLDDPTLTILQVNPMESRDLTENQITSLHNPSTVLQIVRPTTNSISSTPDHSYSTVTQTTKRKITHTTKQPSTDDVNSSDDDNEDDESDCSMKHGCKETVVGLSKELVKRKKYLERRKKNNIASKRSRETRKSKFVSMDEQTRNLEMANDELRHKIMQLEELTTRMKDVLVKKLNTTAR